MSKADERRAFEAMMDEISDSDDDAGRDTPPTAQSRVSGSAALASPAFSLQAEPKRGLEQPYSSFRGISAKAAKEQQDIENFGCENFVSNAPQQSEQLSFMKRWLTRPCSRSERSSMKCYVEREKSALGLTVAYRLYAEGTDGQQPRFMMAAKKKSNKQTSYYLISLDVDPTDDRGSESVLGKVRGNMIGSRYLITDGGVAPDRTVAPSMLRKEYGIVGFEFDSGGPSRIEAWVPAVSASGVAAIWQPDSEANGMEACVESKKLDKLFTLRNKTPKWDESHGGHVLNFQGRVTESSVKNFQLCCLESDDPDDVVLQFGRVGKNKFTMDLKYPLSPFQAFGICVGCLDGKIADRKGYEYLRRLSLTGGGSSSESRSHAAASASGAADAKDQQQCQSDGSMKGSSTMSGMIRESLPSGQYLRDKLYRSFK